MLLVEGIRPSSSVAQIILYLSWQRSRLCGLRYSGPIKNVDAGVLRSVEVNLNSATGERLHIQECAKYIRSTATGSIVFHIQ